MLSRNLHREPQMIFTLIIVATAVGIKGCAESEQRRYWTGCVNATGVLDRGGTRTILEPTNWLGNCRDGFEKRQIRNALCDFTECVD